MQERNTCNAPNLFSPIEAGSLVLRNRVVMAPLTRSRAGPGNVPTQLNALYYAQRASAGLIISEATQISPEGQGYISVVTSVAFSPDGARVLTGSTNATARLWDAATGEEIRAVKGHEDLVLSVAFSPNGTQVLTGSGDKTPAYGTYRAFRPAASSISPAPGCPTMTSRALARSMASISSTRRRSARRTRAATSPPLCPASRQRNDGQSAQLVNWDRCGNAIDRCRF
jgi:NADH:flavin oxidoreductase / NADH oxidase family/WD domain, G-beta repeat